LHHPKFFSTFPKRTDLDFLAEHKLDEFGEGGAQLSDDVHDVARVLRVVVLETGSQSQPWLPDAK
jgi:hypothetical protein